MQVLIKEPSEHSHAPDPDRLHVIRLKNEIKLRGASSDEGASTILFDVLRSTPLTAAPYLPTNEALLQIIRRERPAEQLDHQGCLPLQFRQTDRGDNFILYEDNSMVIFTCDKNLSVLNQCKHWFMFEKNHAVLQCQQY
jgi:hypothetical protein